MLELKNICFTREGKKILDNVSLTLDEDKFYVITGPNGSGKSTLAKIIMGIEKQDSGEILYNNEDITHLSIDERANLGISYSFQQPVKFKGITVYDLVCLASKKFLTKEDVCQILTKIGLCTNEYINREVNDSLSGGELKRIEIASVSVRDSKLTIFDEPEAGIDLWSFDNLIELFKDIRKNTNGSTIIISHQEKIFDIADKIILLKNGKIEKIGNKEDVIGSFNNKRKKCCHEGCINNE
ncbi:MAG: ATP-binding cassette domain-containing protein [bacterium]|nr:ATP-binding cassette domain-containing protein [bacterium]